MRFDEHPFPPVMDADCHTLILGSYPSVRSRAEGFYYGHPQNRFWRVLAGVWQTPVPQSIPEKRALLLGHGAALWDVIGGCDITGSGDASVRNARPVDIRRVLDACDIRRVLANGRLAWTLYGQLLQPVAGLPARYLPSTSPANAACSLQKLIAAWQVLGDA